MGSRVVKRAYKYRFYPTIEQERQLAATFGCVRYVYNRALAERSRAWTQEQCRISYAESDKMLTAWKRDPETSWLTEPSKGPLQATLRNLQGAFDRFWRKQTGYPTFKKKGKAKDSATYFSNCFTFRDGQLKLDREDVSILIEAPPTRFAQEVGRRTLLRASHRATGETELRPSDRVDHWASATSTRPAPVG
jgi:putative transposase